MSQQITPKRFCVHPKHQLVVSLLVFFGLVLCSPHHAFAAPHHQIESVRSPVLYGELPYQYTAHYFGIEVNQRDGLIALTLAYDPQNNPNLRGLVNFMVLDEDGMRRFLAGTNPRDVQLATGAPLQFDPVGNKLSAAFQAVGRGKYTVIVFNNAQLPVQYTLTAEGAQLLDNANQSRDPNAIPTTPVENPTSEMVLNPSPLGNAGGHRLSGVLDNTIGRHYLQVLPIIRDGNLVFDFHYDPLDQPELHGNVNFWILDEEGLNAIIRGEKAVDVNLATGFPVPFNPFPNDLQASFNASGRNPYTAVIFNRTKIPATYEMSVDGGELVDRYGQTLEAKANMAPATAAPTTNASTVTTGTVTFVSARSNVKLEENELAPVSLAGDVALDGESGNRLADNESAGLRILGVPQLAGSFKQAYSHHYFALTPTVRDGKITLSLAFDPQNNQTLRENINFLVLTEEGLRSVLAGGPPVNYDIATGAFGLFGANQNRLFATFQASGHGSY
ncbi:MAG: hypothetical protein KDE19_23205, partial [Caldilineaceae bacterium]|nr:hypothetical protein [Caldilineaceae bacterium]